MFQNVSPSLSDAWLYYVLSFMMLYCKTYRPLSAALLNSSLILVQLSHCISILVGRFDVFVGPYKNSVAIVNQNLNFLASF